MTRDIDFTKPLDEDEKAYVADRPWLLQDARLRGEDIIEEEDFYLDDDTDDTDDTGDTGTGDEGNTEDDSSDDSNSEDDESEEEDEIEDEEVAPYEEWEYSALQEEAKSRDLSGKGSKEQLINRLKENDEVAPEGDE